MFEPAPVRYDRAVLPRPAAAADEPDATAARYARRDSDRYYALFTDRSPGGWSDVRLCRFDASAPDPTTTHSAEK